jgi:hypothetical protein
MLSVMPTPAGNSVCLEDGGGRSSMSVFPPERIAVVPDEHFVFVKTSAWNGYKGFELDGQATTLLPTAVINLYGRR